MDPKIDRFGFLLFALPLLAVAVALVVVPVSYDEAWTFLNFTRKGFAYSASHYPAPNNHILHSLLTVAADALPGLKHLWKIRLFPLLWYALGLLATFRIVRAHYSRNVAWLVTAVASSFFMTVYYGYMSRGYGLAYLLFVLSVGQALWIAKGQGHWKRWVLLSLFSALGLYAIPSYLYAFVTLHVFLFVSRPKGILPQLASGLGTAALTALLYLPLLRTEGIGAITDNPFVEPIGLSQTFAGLPGFLADLLYEITGLPRWLVVVVLVVAAWQLVRARQRMLLVLGICCLVVPVVLLLVQRTIPFPRTFHYLAFPMVLLLLAPFAGRLSKLRPALVLGIGLTAQASLLALFAFRIGAYEDRDLALNTTAAKIIPEIAGDKRYLFVGTLLPTNLEFELIERGFTSYHIEYGYVQDAATVTGFDYVVIDRAQDRTKVEPLYRTDFYTVYEK